jgi:predicted transcriptional regulator
MTPASCCFGVTNTIEEEVTMDVDVITHQQRERMLAVSYCYNVRTLAQYLCVSPSTVYRALRRLGELPAKRTVGKFAYFRANGRRATLALD